MISSPRFKCPVCDFTVFNRRAAKCESCAAALPNELRFTPEELKFIDAEHASNELIRQQIAQRGEAEAELRRRSYITTYAAY